MTFENYDDQQADVQKCSILPKSQNCTNWLFREHFSKVVKFVQFDAAISGGISAYWPSLTIYIDKFLKLPAPPRAALLGYIASVF